MLYFIHGTDFKKRELSKKEIKSSLKEKLINYNSLLKVEEISKENLFLIKNYFKSNSLFGEKLLIQIEDILSREDTREFLYENIKNMIDSENIFILNESLAPAPSILKIENILKKEKFSKNIFNCKEEKVKKDIEPFYLCDLIEKRDKRGAWREFQKIYLEWEDEEAQALHGAIWWKWKMIWSAYLDSNKSNHFRVYKLREKEIKYTKQELEKFGSKLSTMAMKANNGEVNLMRSLEKFILEI
jgi:hypothetical protein